MGGGGGAGRGLRGDEGELHARALRDPSVTADGRGVARRGGLLLGVGGGGWWMRRKRGKGTRRGAWIAVRGWDGIGGAVVGRGDAWRLPAGQGLRCLREVVSQGHRISFSQFISGVSTDGTRDTG